MRTFGWWFVALAGCGGPSGTPCTDLPVIAVALTAVDPAGAPIPGATGTYTRDGGAVTDCEGQAGGPGAVACGVDTPGTYAVTVSAPGFAPQTQTSTVSREADGCHVAPASGSITLSPG